MTSAPLLGQHSTTPIFNTKAVARETDVPADTFRAWERRYGIPQPQRTAGGHRLYSKHDIAVIRWLRDRTIDGMNISQAVALLHSSLVDVQPQLISQPPEAAPRTISHINNDIITSLVGFDAKQADRLLTEAFAIYSFEDVMLLVVLPTMVEVGERWHRGEINIAVEHFATQFMRRKIANLLNVFQGNEQRGKIIVACAPSEQHELGALFAALFLARRGWNVMYLGPQLPLFDLLEVVATVKPDLVCLSASMPDTAHQVGEVARALQYTAPELAIGYGGRVFNLVPSLRDAVPGTFLGQDARELVDNVAVLLNRDETSIV